MRVIDMVAIERQYAGQWVALTEDRRKGVADGATLEEARAKALRKGVKDPILTKIPRESLEYLL